ncbi:uncharacterized protein LOC110035152, partial [Phalaenopsis equestris]|uniref:uncharacterized protein LOC110035152 n=1 Tax=Phalaenopsis equestris TaxID=78828 RepID=UPI0009E2A02E
MALAALCSPCLTSIGNARSPANSFRSYPPFSLFVPLRHRRLAVHSKKTQSLKASSSSSISSASPGTKDDGFKLTYLEGNSWLWSVDGVNVLVDPILVGNLDFG